MKTRWITRLLIACLLCSTGRLLCATPEEILTAYKTLRTVPIDPSRTVHVEELLLPKETAEFELTKGEFHLFEPVMDRVTGGIFVGEGVFRLTPSEGIERDRIQRLNDWSDLEEPFEELVLFFTDETYDMVKEGASEPDASTGSDLEKRVEKIRELLREKLHSNIPARLAADLSSDAQTGYFLAFIKFKDGRTFYFVIDPTRREPVKLYRYKADRFQKWLSVESWYSERAGDEGKFHPLVDTRSCTLDISIDKKQVLSGEATLVFTPLTGGARMLPMNLASKLRVESVVRGDDTKCLFIQEDKDEDADLWVILPESLVQDDTVNLTVTYSGEDVVKNAGSGNYFVLRRTLWYPSISVFSDRALYEITFRVPKKMTLIGTGTRVEEWSDAENSYTKWESGIPLKVAGFNYGKFQSHREEDRETGAAVTCYTNTGLKDKLFVLRKRLEENEYLRSGLMLHPQELTTKKMTKDVAIQGLNAYNIYTYYFGEIPFKEIVISQQPAGSYGQGWPTLIYLPYTALLKPSVRDRLGLKSDEFYETVASHEVAHQWWGHIVGAETYHDLWLEEGFAQYSAALYTLRTEGEDSFVEFMKNRRNGVVREVRGSDRLTDVGPICLGRRLNTIENPRNSFLVYDKGAFVLHMMRMMLYDYREGSDEKFADMMKDFVSTHFNRNASTDDFQAIAEKHFGRDLDWFFNQWVYGTDVPSYTFNFVINPTTDGKYILTLEATQSNVSPDFQMPLPFMIQFENGFQVVNLPMVGENTVRRQFKVPIQPEKITPNPWESVLAEEVRAPLHGRSGPLSRRISR